MLNQNKTKQTAARKAAYRAANKERSAAYQAAYYAANKERIAAEQAAYRAANKERLAAKGAAYRAANRERLAAGQRASCADLKGSYVAALIGLPIRGIPHPLLATKREQLKLYRAIRKLKETLNDKVRGNPAHRAAA